MYSRMKYCSWSAVWERWVVSWLIETSTRGAACSPSSPGRTISSRRSGARICARVSPEHVAHGQPAGELQPAAGREPERDRQLAAGRGHLAVAVQGRAAPRL